MVNNKFRIVITFGVGCRRERWDMYIQHVLGFILFRFILHTFLHVLNAGIMLFKTLEPLELWEHKACKYHYGLCVQSASLNSHSLW